MIYFIQHAEDVTAPIKIGFTQATAEARLKKLQTGSAHKLAVLATVSGDIEDESRQHERWKHLRLSGEWFSAGLDLRQYISALRMTHEPSTAWFDLAVTDPRLLELLQRAQAVVDEGEEAFCANHRWIGCGPPQAACPKCNGGLKPKLQTLVGWNAEKAELQSSAAYDVAYQKIYAALPGCRGCMCLSLDDLETE